MTTHPGLSDDWQIGPDGLRYRKAARIVIFDENNRVLLIRGHDFSDDDHWWWFTIGGGRESGETPHQCAIRELYEETGITISADDLVGPVLSRRALFRFRTETCQQDEEFFLCRIPGSTPLSYQGLTELEQDVIDELKWWTIDDLEAEVARGVVIYPYELVDLLRSWQHGWDGTCPILKEHN